MMMAWHGMAFDRWDAWIQRYTDGIIKDYDLDILSLHFPIFFK